MRTMGKSDFSGLVKYIADEQNKTERLGLVRVTNCEADTMQAVIGEVLATQQCNTRAKGDKTYHLIVSFRAGEKPDKDTLGAVEQRICAGLGYSEYQRVSAVHYDTDNLHIHIAINKIHPTKNTMHEPYQAYRTMGDLCELLEGEYGLGGDNHQARKRVSENRSDDMERHAGIESLVSWIKRECLDDIRGAETWKDLHQVMNENGLEMRLRANGFVIESDDGTRIKASTVARDLSKAKMEDKLGTFKRAENQGKKEAKKFYDKRPAHFKVNTNALYAKYKEDQESLTIARKVDWDRFRDRKDHNIEAAKRVNRLRRSIIRLMGNDRVAKKFLYMQAHKALKETVKSINEKHKKERQELYDQYKRRAWADWLKQQAMEGNENALEALRAREQAQGLKGDTIQGAGDSEPVRVLVADNITKKGTIIFRAGNGAVRDDGEKLQVSKEATSETVKEALRVTMERYGNRISVTGSPQFKAQVIHSAATSNLPITFSDAGLERRRQELLIKQESRDDRQNNQIARRDDRGRNDRGRNGRAERGVAQHDDCREGRVAGGTGPGRIAAGHRADAGNDSGNVLDKPHVASVGGKPPAIAKNRLRTLSSLGVVRFARGSEVLLPSDVSSELEHHGAKPDNALRWGVFGARLTPDQTRIADKYIKEREGKRAKGFDIPKHSRYNSQDDTLVYSGTRSVDGQSLALLNRADEILVLPIDKATAQRLKHVRIGEVVTVTPKGSVKMMKGKSR